MSSNKPLVHTTYKMVKEGINNMETEKPLASKSKKDKFISNKSNKGTELNKSMSLDKSRPSQRNETEDTVKPLKKGLSPQPVYLIKV